MKGRGFKETGAKQTGQYDINSAFTPILVIYRYNYDLQNEPNMSN